MTYWHRLIYFKPYNRWTVSLFRNGNTERTPWSTENEIYRCKGWVTIWIRLEQECTFICLFGGKGSKWSHECNNTSGSPIVHVPTIKSEFYYPARTKLPGRHAFALCIHYGKKILNSPESFPDNCTSVMEVILRHGVNERRRNLLTRYGNGIQHLIYRREVFRVYCSKTHWESKRSLFQFSAR